MKVESAQLIQEDLASLLRALDLGSHARDASPHQVVIEEIIPEVLRLKEEAQQAKAAIGDVLASDLLAETAKHERILAQVEALLPEAPRPLFDGGANFMGFNREIEHRTVGPHRAWCFDANEWCSPQLPCRSCDPPVHRAELLAALEIKEGSDGG